MKLLSLLSVFIIFTIFFTTNAIATQGCCSYHGGVAYCGDNGRYVCNDGTYSPSCTCAVTAPSTFNNPFSGGSSNTSGSSYCGAGQWYNTKAEADGSLQQFKNTACVTQDQMLDTQGQKIGTLNLKVWVNFILLVITALAAVAGFEQEKWRWIPTVLLTLLMFGGFLFLIP